MGTSETAPFGPVTSVREIARFDMEARTRQLEASYKPCAVENSKAPTVLGSGVTGVVEMDQ